MRILLGENRPQFSKLILERLRASFSADWAAGLSVFKVMAAERGYALLVLGLDMGHDERIELLREYRSMASQTRLMVIAEQASVRERVQALESGADEFIVRPFHMEEFVARVKVLLRRVNAAQDASVRAGRLELNNDDGQIYCAGTRVDLHQAERRLLAMMMIKSGRLVSKETIEGALGGDAATLSPNAIEQRVSRLRKILDTARANIQIKTVRGMGYMLETATAEAPNAANDEHKRKQFGDAAE